MICACIVSHTLTSYDFKIPKFKWTMTPKGFRIKLKLRQPAVLDMKYSLQLCASSWPDYFCKNSSTPRYIIDCKIKRKRRIICQADQKLIGRTYHIRLITKHEGKTSISSGKGLYITHHPWYCKGFSFKTVPSINSFSENTISIAYGWSDKIINKFRTLTKIYYRDVSSTLSSFNNTGCKNNEQPCVIKHVDPCKTYTICIYTTLRCNKPYHLKPACQNFSIAKNCSLNTNQVLQRINISTKENIDSKLSDIKIALLVVAFCFIVTVFLVGMTYKVALKARKDRIKKFVEQEELNNNNGIDLLPVSYEEIVELENEEIEEDEDSDGEKKEECKENNAE